jgi:hypothetical protein
MQASDVQALWQPVGDRVLRLDRRSQARLLRLHAGEDMVVRQPRRLALPRRKWLLKKMRPGEDDVAIVLIV